MSYGLLIFLIACLAAMNPVAIDVFLPAMPEIAKEMAVDPGTVGITIGVYTFGTALGQMIYGPGSDKFGRKPLLIFGLAIFVVGAVASAFATTIEALTAWRFLQGMGAACGRILAMAIVRDGYEREQAAKLLNYMMAVASIMPMIGPLIGSILIEYFAWQSVFVYITLFGVMVLLIVAFFFKETLVEKNHRAVHPVDLVINSRVILSNRLFVAYTLCSAFSGMGLLAFLSAGPEIVINLLDQGRNGFAIIFAIMMVGSMSGNIIGARIGERVGIDRLMGWSSAFATLFGILLLVFALTDIALHYIAALVLPLTLFKLCDSITNSQATAGALTPFPRMAGLASTVLGVFRQSAGATMAVLVGLFSDGTTILPLAMGVTVAGIVPAAIYVFQIRRVQPAS